MEPVDNGAVSDRSSNEKAANHHLGDENHSALAGVAESKAGAANHSTADGEPLVDPDANVSEADRAVIDRKLLWKLDLQLIPWLCILYLLAFLDRTNIGNAKIDNMAIDLKLSSFQYNGCLTIFFVSYALFEPLTNVMLKRFRPSVFIPIIMGFWGLTMTLMGLVTSYSGLMAARWFLGLFEAGLFPGINYYLSCWYKRDEFGIRAAIFFSAAAVSGSFGGLLAAAIGKMEGVGGYHGWQWIFILEGLLTFVCGIASFWIVHDFPDNATFLNPQDRQRVIWRLHKDMQQSARVSHFDSKYMWQSIKDAKMYIGMVIYMGCDMPLYAFSLFLPSIITNLGISKSTTTNQLLTVPPYAVAAVFTVFIGWLADRTRQRGFCNIAVSFLAITGFSMLIGSTNAKVQYAGTFLGALGIYPCIANTISWVANNVEGVYKRGIVLGVVIGWGNLNGIVSSNIYRAQDVSDGYKLGHGIVLAYLVLFLLGGSIVMYLHLKHENASRVRVMGIEEEETVEPGSERRGIDAYSELGDKDPHFIYSM